MERAGLRALVAALPCASAQGDFVFLTSPQWTPSEQAAADAAGRQAAAGPADVTEGWLCVPTGGTSGALRFARHDERTVDAAVEGFCRHFGTRHVNAVGVLPDHHVSGLMARVRCAATGGRHLPWSWKRLEAGELPELSAGDWFLSVVPTQLQRLISAGSALPWLRRFRAVLLGGAPAWPQLLQQARFAGLPLAITYGSTETAAMVTALRPDEFAAGVDSCGPVLPHADLATVDPDTGEPCPPGQAGLIRIRGASVHRGYFGGEASGGEVRTEDLGRFDERGHLRILGRRDQVIISGGEKISPVEVEAVLLAAGLADVAVVGLPDPDWGQVVVACYPAGSSVDVETLRTFAADRLAPFKQPKRYVAVPNWPRNEYGKLRRAELFRRLG